MTAGSIALVGAGPGDPELLTMKALRYLQDAEVVVFDRLVSREVLALVPTGASRIYAGKAHGDHHMSQDEINALLLNLARSGRRVVRLKGGDPFIFGRGSEEAEFLARHGVSFEVIPGISAASGCSAYAGVPLTHRGLATGVRFITGHCQSGRELDHDWASLADPDTTLVVYMGLHNLERIAGALVAAGLPGDTPAAAVQSGTTPRQRRIVGTLASLPGLVAENGFAAPTVIIVGRVVELADSLQWFRPAAEADDRTVQA